MEYLNIIIFGVIVLFAFLGYKKGLIMTVVDLGCWVLSIFGAYIFSPILNKIIQKTNFFQELVITISQGLNFGEIAKNGQRTMIESFNLPTNMENYLLSNNNPDFYLVNGISSIEQYVGFVIASIIVGIASFVAVIIIIRISIGLIKGIFGLFSNLPIIKSFDKMGGLIAGLGKGFIIAWLIMLLILVFIETNQYQEYMTIIEESKFLSFVYSTNIFINFFFK